MNWRKMTAAVALAVMALVPLAVAAEGVAKPAPSKIVMAPCAAGEYPQLWDRDELFQLPKASPATDLHFDFEYSEDLKPIYLEGISYQGKPTRFFAWLGMPKDIPAGQKVPGVVLVHGGGGTAFAQWTEDWVARGYAVIAMDTVGCRPLTRFEGEGARTPLEGDRPGLHDYTRDVANPHDSWTAHAVSTVVRAHSYLRSLPQVDADRIGIMGISWGGYLTCITAAVDHRFAAAVPVYGCGFLGETDWTVKDVTRPWLELFDPCRFLASVKCPILFANRPVDPPYTWEQWVRSSLLPANAQRSCRLNLGHSHSQGRVPEAYLFLDAYCKGIPKLPRIYGQQIQDGGISARFQAYTPIERATIAWTEDPERLFSAQRRWKEAPAGILGDTITAQIPEKATYYFLNLYDIRGGVVSTEGFGWKK